MSYKDDFRQLLKPYYWFNILLSASYIACKLTSPVCTFMFPSSSCELDNRETEILFFLIIVVMLRSRKTGSLTMINYLSSSFMYTKIANLILWFYADIRWVYNRNYLFIKQAMPCGLVCVAFRNASNILITLTGQDSSLYKAGVDVHW